MAEYIIDKIAYNGDVYKLQDNQSGYITSVGLSNATNGGLSISGSPITSSGSITVGHSNVLTSAQTTSGIYPIKIDKNGHISEYGSAVSIPTKTSDLTNDSGFITSYTDEKLKTTAITADSTERYFILDINSNTSSTKTRTTSALSYYLTSNNLSILGLGNINIKGKIRLYNGSGNSTGYSVIQPGASGSSIVTLTLPTTSGTLALTSDVPSISLNGSSTTSASFYAPTTAGTSGQVLTSNGSGEPTWAAAPSGSSTQIIRWTES